jgi:hypothetical protein
MILVDGGDNAQHGFQRSECFRGSYCDVEGNAENSTSGALPVALRNWYMLGEDQRHNDIDTYPPAPLMVRLFLLWCQHCPLLVWRIIEI